MKKINNSSPSTFKKINVIFIVDGNICSRRDRNTYESIGATSSIERLECQMERTLPP